MAASPPGPVRATYRPATVLRSYAATYVAPASGLRFGCVPLPRIMATVRRDRRPSTDCREARLWRAGIPLRCGETRRLQFNIGPGPGRALSTGRVLQFPDTRHLCNHMVSGRPAP